MTISWLWWSALDFRLYPTTRIQIKHMSVIQVDIPSLFASIEMTLSLYISNLTPKYRIEAPIKVAECPPLGDGGTPSIYGKAQNHFLSISKYAYFKYMYFLAEPFALPRRIKPCHHLKREHRSLKVLCNSCFALQYSHFTLRFGRYTIPYS